MHTKNFGPFFIFFCFPQKQGQSDPCSRKLNCSGLGCERKNVAATGGSTYDTVRYLVLCYCSLLQVRLNISRVKICYTHKKTRTSECPKATEAETVLVQQRNTIVKELHSSTYNIEKQNIVPTLLDLLIKNF